MRDTNITLKGGFQLAAIIGLVMAATNAINIFLNNKILVAASIIIGILQVVILLGLRSMFAADVANVKNSLALANDSDEGQVCFFIRELSSIDLKVKKLRQKVAYYTTSQSDIIAENCKLLIDTQRDRLTQLYNRRFLENKINLLHNTGRPYAVMFCDIDHFKSINDNHGHGVGDEILKQVAQRIVQNVRPGDTVARYGGEEFVMLAPDIGKRNQALMLAERVRRSISEQQFDVGSLQLSVTISIGVSLRHGADTVEALLKSADECLYEAKNSGRNRVVLA